MSRKAVIFGLMGHKLSQREKSFFKKSKPWGIILFSRNIRDLKQLKILIDSIKKIFNDNKYPILIDVEGGKVSRLDKIIDLSVFSQSFFGKLYKKDKKLFYVYYKIYTNAVTDILKFVGININTVPVLDVFRNSSHPIIGSRSFSNDPKQVQDLGKICVDLYQKNGIATVIKHVPGHGPAKCDSHYETPIIKKKKKELKKNDFYAFKKSKSFFAMTAHAIFNSYDKKNTATHSKILVKKIIRGYIKFKGLLISDDISMKSLKFSIEKNAVMSLEAGCNLVLHCNGNMQEMTRLMKVIPNINKFTQKKTSDFYKFLG